MNHISSASNSSTTIYTHNIIYRHKQVEYEKKKLFEFAKISKSATKFVYTRTNNMYYRMETFANQCFDEYTNYNIPCIRYK